MQDRPPHAQHSHHTLPSASPSSSVTLRSPAAVGPSPPRQHSLPSPLCQSKCPCAFRPWLRCRLHREDFPDHTSTASLTPSERPEHSAKALVTPLPSVTPVAWWLSCSAFRPSPLSPPHGRARHTVSPQQLGIGPTYEGSRRRAPGGSSGREHNSRAEESEAEIASPPCRAPGSKPTPPGLAFQASHRGNLQFRPSLRTRARAALAPYHGNLAPLSLINSLILPNSQLQKRERVPCSECLLQHSSYFDYSGP